MNEEDVSQYIQATFSGVKPTAAWGETSFFYNPGNALPRGVYFATLKNKDGANDQASNLSREGIFRLNLGLSKNTYQSLLGPIPGRPPAGGIVQTGHDFSALDILLPHPVYAWMGWACALNPSESTFAHIKPLLAEAYQLAVGKFDNRVKKR
jgi:Family of unknown function (DUF6194)